MHPPEFNLQDKLDNDLCIYQKLTLDNHINDMVKAASRYTGEQKSTIVRICVIKELYNNRDKLVRTNEQTIRNLWENTKRKFDVGIEMLVNKLYLNLEPNFVKNKIGRIDEIGNLMSIRDFYEKFKNTQGYNAMLEYKRGNKVDATLKEV